MKANEIRDLTTAEIEQNEKSLKEELFNLRFQLATGQLRKYCPHSRGSQSDCSPENRYS